MSNRRDDRRIFNKRVAIFAIIELALGCAVLARLAYLQIYCSFYYSLLSDKNRIVTKQILPTRGMILDAQGRILATNRHVYTAVLDLYEISQGEHQKVVKELLERHNLSPAVQRKLTNLPKMITNTNRYIPLQENLEWADLSKYYITASKIPGILIEKNQSRTYNYPCEFSHVIGYIGAPSKKDLETRDNAALSLPMAKVGKTGIEKKYDEKLFGTVGIKHIEVNSRRQFIRNIDDIKESPGDDIILTINLDLQLAVYKILSKYKGASCVVMELSLIHI